MFSAQKHGAGHFLLALLPQREPDLQLQQLEEAQLQHREANLTALAAIGPRKKRALEQPESQVRGAGGQLEVCS